ncbi:hypothetical protein QQS21_000935 [Conoideocrella luteorostrata]|uniref:DUF7820 domain-containing protein n=1 Tax=Conoideocrella luteorostrata TaxID=1105319 RepID=A0AAJ0G3Q1_9HYPO|nr:hypothetical protein QQS21_000935 [Conoideocrella luteorostrata]
MPPGDRNSGSERRSAARRSVRLSEDDEYDLTANAVSDGFRPTASAARNGPAPSLPSASQPTPNPFLNLPRSPPPAISVPSKGFADFDRPSSTSKPPRLHDSLTLRNDGLTSSRGGQSSSASSSTQVDSQYQGSTQPSHPYQMYPQRTYSNATSSTEPLSTVGTLDESRDATHPYAMYTQNTTDPEDPNRRPIPVGFNGMGNAYRRQLGPDGEEAGDLIGPLGHMEELPPYTRYPQEEFSNKPATATGNTTSPTSNGIEVRPVGLTVSTPVQQIPGAGGIGLATRNPEFSSTEDLPSQPHRSGSVRSVPSVESYHDINGAARDFAEKPTQSKWERRAKKKLWGIVPYWAICLLLSCIVILGTVMGAVIGTILTRHRGPPPGGDKQYDSRPRITSNVEYEKSLPGGVPPLDPGCFALPTMEKYLTTKTCLKDSSQTPAWSCDIPFRWYSMNVIPLHDQPNISNYALKLAPFNPKASRFIWGEQPPDIPEFKTLSLVKDLEERNRGPAWYLEVDYNKTVILRENQLHPTSGSGAAKRRWDATSSPGPGLDKSRFMRKSVAATDGDKPWICTWPNIKLQVFIYPNQTFTPANTSTASGPSATGVTDSPSPPGSKGPYPRLVKFVEKRPDNVAAATCTQYEIINGEKVVNYGEDGKPVSFVVNEVSKGPQSTITERLVSTNTGDDSSLDARGVNLTPCGCVQFSWSV